MADKNIQMTQRNATNDGWDNLNPITKAANVKFADGTDVESHKADYTLQVPFAVTTGTANTYAVTLNPALTSYVAGVAVCVKINAANTGASTLNINGLGAKAMLDSKGNAMTSGKLRLNGIYTLRYDGTNFILQGEGGSGNATASDLLSGKTASTDAGDIVGTLALTGTATVDDVVSGKTFYNTDTKAKLTGTFSNIKSIQRGKLTVSSSVGQTDITISSVDLTKSIIVIDSWTGQANLEAYGEFINNTTIRIYSNSSEGINFGGAVVWQVIEFNNVKTKQSGSVNMANITSATVTISSVNASKSVVLLNSKNPNASANTQPCAELTNNTTLTLSCWNDGSRQVIAYWQVIEFN